MTEQLDSSVLVLMKFQAGQSENESILCAQNMAKLVKAYVELQKENIRLQERSDGLRWLIENSSATILAGGTYGPYRIWCRFSNRTTDEFIDPMDALKAAMNGEWQ